MPNVVPALGTKLYMAPVGETPTYAEIGGVLSIGYPSAEVNEIDVSNLASGQIMTFRPGRTDPGEVSYDLQFDPADTAGHVALRAMVYAPTPKLWRITSPTTPVKGEDFPGYVKSCTPAVEGPDGNLEASVTIRVSGAATPYTAD